MANYRVRDLDAMLAQLGAAGARVDDKVEEYDYGRFGWADPEGNGFELWEPKVSAPGSSGDALGRCSARQAVAASAGPVAKTTPGRRPRLCRPREGRPLPAFPQHERLFPLTRLSFLLVVTNETPATPWEGGSGSVH